MSKTTESNGGVASEPLLTGQQKKIQEMKILDEKDVDGAVYKSTVDQVDLNQGSRYVGLSKEELERYVHDPFWRKLRCLFLTLFWLAWIGMFAAAIAIVIASPKCPPKPELQWFEKKMCYQIWSRSFQDSDNNGVGDLNGITSRLRQMVGLKASAIWPVPLLNSEGHNGYGVVNHKQIDPELGSIEDFDKLIKTVVDNKMALIMDLPLTTVSVKHDWFQKSVNDDPAFRNYFIWTANSVGNSSSQINNKGSYYRHWGNRSNFAILNWDYEPVRQSLKEAAKFWLDKGVDGFYLGEVQYMSLNSNGQANWPKIHSYLKDFNEYLRNNSNGRKILTFTSGGFDEPTFGISIQDFKVNMRKVAGVDYVINNELVLADSKCDAKCFRKHLLRVIDHHNTTDFNWPMWEVGQPYVSRLATRMGRPKAEQIMMLLLNLPGSVNVYYGDEILMGDSEKSGVSKFYAPRSAMQWANESNAGFTKHSHSEIHINSDYATINVENQAKSTNSPLRMFRRLAGLRRTEDALLYGKVELAKEHDQLLVMNVASNYSSTTYLTVLNFGNDAGVFNLMDTLKFDLASLKGSKDCQVVTMTTNLATRGKYRQREPIDVQNLDLLPNEGVVIKVKPIK